MSARCRSIPSCVPDCRATAFQTAGWPALRWVAYSTADGSSIRTSCRRTPKWLAAAQFMLLAVYVERHRLACFQRHFDKLLCLVDPDLDVAATPLKPEAEAVPVCRQLRIEPYASALGDSPANPHTAVCQIPPRPAMCTPPSIATWVSVRSIAAVCRKWRSASSE